MVPSSTDYPSRVSQCPGIRNTFGNRYSQISLSQVFVSVIVLCFNGYFRDKTQHLRKANEMIPLPKVCFVKAESRASEFLYSLFRESLNNFAALQNSLSVYLGLQAKPNHCTCLQFQIFI